MKIKHLKGVLLSALIIASLMVPLLLISAGVARGQEIEWARQFGTSGHDQAKSVAVDSSGNVYVTSDVSVIKYDSSGNEIWTKDVGANGVAIDSSGNVYIIGGSLVKYDSSGNEIWTKDVGANGVAVDSSGNVYVTGNAFVRKYDSSGNELWTGQFVSDNELWAGQLDSGYERCVVADMAESVAVDAFGNVYIVGQAVPTQIAREGGGLTNFSLGDAFVRKYDGSGNEIWTKQRFEPSKEDSAESVAVDASGYVYVAGYTDGALPGQTFSGGWDDAFVRKYDGSGNEIWTRQFGTYGNDQSRGVAVDASGNVYVAGYTEGALPGQTNLGEMGFSDAFVRKYDGSGNEIWTRQFGTSGYDWASGVAVDAFGNVYVAGWTYGTLPGQTKLGARSDYDAFLVKLGAAAGPMGWPLIAGIVVIIVVIGIGLAVYVKRR